MEAAPDALPNLELLGRDLLRVPTWRRTFSLVLPFALTAAFFVLASRGWWLCAVFCPVALSFVTYGSTSHDLVHRNLHIPHGLNEILLSAIELSTFRSGHAYRASHLHHHAHFAQNSDLEGAAAKMTLVRALLDGVTLQPRLWLHAMKRADKARTWVIGEGIAIVLLVVACAAAWRTTPLPAIYAALVIAGSWVFPFVTAWAVHDASATNALHQTRLFRGRGFALLSLEHLYHLEHHLYPGVPHQNWPQLAQRLDPYFDRVGLVPMRLLF